MTPDVLDWVQVPELEWLNVDRPLADEVIADVIRVAGMLKSTRINVGVGIGTSSPVPIRDVCANVAMLADALAPHRIMVALEPIAFGWLPKVADVYGIVHDVNRPNLGLLLDVFHVHADPTWSHEMIPAHMIAEVQLAGTMAQYPAGKHDRFMAAMDRPSITDSAMDITQWLKHLITDRGYAGPVSYETPHARNANMGLNMIARNIARDIATI
jgi:sugar phosphate isomerase/epimerase